MPHTPKDWKDLPDRTTPLSAAAIEDLETRLGAYADTKIPATEKGAASGVATLDGTSKLTAAQLPSSVVSRSPATAAANTVTAVGASTPALTLVTDNPNTLDGANLILANATAGANPANTPGITYKKDGTSRWNLGLDVQAGTQGDFAFFHNWVAVPGSSRDVLYITDEEFPKVAINGDRNSPGTLTIYSPAGAPVSRAAMHFGLPAGQTGALLFLTVTGRSDTVLEFAPNPAIRMLKSDYNFGSGDAASNRGTLYVNSAGDLKYVSPSGTAKVTTIGPSAPATVAGSRGGNAALADLLTKLATLGYIVDGTTA